MHTCRNNKVKFVFKQALRNTVTRQNSTVDTFYMQKLVSADDNETAYACVDPLFMLFNEERLQKLGTTAVEKWLKSIEQGVSSSLDKLRKECSDDDLLYMIKSRHIQKPCEVSAWSDYMAENMDKFKDLMAAEIANKKVEEAALVQTESTKTV